MQKNGAFQQLRYVRDSATEKELSTNANEINEQKRNTSFNINKSWHKSIKKPNSLNSKMVYRHAARYDDLLQDDSEEEMVFCGYVLDIY